MIRCLYVAWNGPEQTYLESLYLPIFAAARAHGVCFEVLELTWGDPSSRSRLRESAERHGVRCSIHTLPPALSRTLRTGAAITFGAAILAREMRRRHVDVVMPRSILPAAMTLGARRLGADFRLAFDADGLMADERVEFADLPTTSVGYRVLREIEAQAIRSADGVLTRTEAARRILEARAGRTDTPFLVVPNGRDPRVFDPGDEASRAATRAELGVARGAPLVAYVGSVAAQYLPAQMARFIARARLARPDTRFIVMTRHVEAFRAAAESVGLSSETGIIGPRDAEAVPALLAASDLGLSFRADSLSQRAVSPIKEGEYLLCGVPILSTTTSSMPAMRRLERFDEAELDRAVGWLVDEVVPERAQHRAAARTLGLETASLEACAEGYASSALLAARAAPRPR